MPTTYAFDDYVDVENIESASKCIVYPTVAEDIIFIETTENVKLYSGENPNLGLDSHGNIYLKSDINKSWNSFKHIEKIITPELKKLEESYNIINEEYQQLLIHLLMVEWICFTLIIIKIVVLVIQIIILLL